MSSNQDDWWKHVVGAVHTAGTLVLNVFGASSAAQALERAETSQGWLPDWAISNAQNRQAAQQPQQARDPGPGFLTGPWDIQIVVRHQLGAAEARRRLDQLAATQAAQYQLQVQWANATQARLSRSGLEGGLQVTPDVVAVGLRVSGLLSLARGKIEQRATELLQAALSGAGLPAAGDPAPANPGAWDSLDRSADPAQVKRLVRSLRDLSGTGITREQAQGIGAVPYLRAGVDVPDPETMATEIDRYFRGLRVSFGARGVRPAARPPAPPPTQAPAPAPVPTPVFSPPPVPAMPVPTPRRWLADPVLSR